MSMHILMTTDFDCITPGLPTASRNVSRPKFLKGSMGVIKEHRRNRRQSTSPRCPAD